MKQLITLILLVGSLAVFGQLGINIHQTNLPFVGLTYEKNDKLRPEYFKRQLGD